MSSARNVTILGDGGFGTALACVQAGRGHRVRIWSHEPDYAAELDAKRENTRFLPGVEIPREIRFGSDLAELLADADVVLSVVPTQFLRGVWERAAPAVPAGVPVVSCSKGMEQSTGRRPSQVIRELAPHTGTFVLTGPSHAEEVARGLPATVVLAGEGDQLEQLQQELSGPTFRIYRSSDPIGAELGGAVKNIVAIAAGASDGLGLGDNAKSALLTRGIVEMARFGAALGARRETFFGLAGIGDLITTAVSPHGRNRALGERIGTGETLDQILASTEKVAEGVWTSRAVLAEARARDVDMPITEEVVAVLFENKPAARAVEDLMTRILKEEDA